MRRGDLVLVRFPFSATAQQSWKQRPVLVLAAEGRGPDEAIFCVMITGSAQRLQHLHDTDVVIFDWHAAGLAKASVIRTRRVWTAESRDVVKRLGSLRPEVTEEVRLRIGAMLGFPPSPPALPPQPPPSGRIS